MLPPLSSPANIPRNTRGAVYPRILNCYAAGLYKGASESDLRRIARYDLILGGVGPDATREIARVRKINPHLRILPYVILRETAAEDPLPESWWARDTAGKKFSFWPGTHVVNLLRPEVQNWLVQRCAKLLADPRLFDGIFLDGYDPGVEYLNSANPGDIDLDGDGKRDDPARRDEKWRAAEESVIRRIGSLRGGKVLIMANTWAVPNWVPKGLIHGFLAEDQEMRIRKGEITLDEFIERCRKVGSKFRQPVLIGSVNGGSDLKVSEYFAMPKEKQAEEAERVRKDTQRMRFGLGVALMGNGHYGYDFGTFDRGQPWWYAEYEKIGFPTGPAKRLESGFWTRRFRNGDGKVTRVFVNGTKQTRIYEDKDAPVTVPPMDTALLCCGDK
jgi:hypothetical protein